MTDTTVRRLQFAAVLLVAAAAAIVLGFTYAMGVFAAAPRRARQIQERSVIER